MFCVFVYIQGPFHKTFVYQWQVAIVCYKLLKSTCVIGYKHIRSEFESFVIASHEMRPYMLYR